MMTANGRVPVSVWDLPITPLARLVLLCLAEHELPSLQTIADRTGLSRRTVTRCLADLERGGHIAIEHRFEATGRQTMNSYRVVTGRVSDRHPRGVIETPSPSPIRVQGGCQTDTPRVSEGHPGQDQGGCQRVTAVLSGKKNPPPTPPKPGGGGAAKRYSPEGDVLARELWEGMKPRPIASFVAFRERISEVLAAGYSAEEMRRAVPNVQAWTRGSIEFTLRRARTARPADDIDDLEVWTPPTRSRA